MSQNNTVGKRGTKIGVNGGKIAITYWDTHVVQFDQNEIALNSNGYRTLTTKTRMNQAANQFGLGFDVFQKKGRWFVNYGKEVIPFTDGMVLSR